jgi:hypothetical protein
MATDFTPRDPDTLVTLDLDDRRRLVVADLRHVMEDQGSGATPAQVGKITLDWAVDDVLQLGDALHKWMHRG